MQSLMLLALLLPGDAPEPAYIAPFSVAAQYVPAPLRWRTRVDARPAYGPACLIRYTLYAGTHYQRPVDYRAAAGYPWPSPHPHSRAAFTLPPDAKTVLSQPTQESLPEPTAYPDEEIPPPPEAK